MADLIPGTDTVTFRLPLKARQRLAADMANPDTPEGAVVAAVGASDSSVAAQVTSGSQTITALSAAYVATQNGRVRSRVKTDGTDQTATIQAEIDALETAGGGVIELPGGTIVATIVMKHRVSITGAGKRRTVVKPPAGSSAAGCITLKAGYVQDAWIENLHVLGNGIAGQHGIYLKATPQAPDNNGGWWESGMRRVRVSGFLGHQIWLRGGDETFMIPHQFLRFEMVEAFAVGTKRALYVTGQVGQVTFDSCQFDGPGLGTAGGENVRIHRHVDDSEADADATSPYALTFINTTFQTNESGLVVSSGRIITAVGCYWETIGFAAVAENSGVLVCEAGNFSNAGHNATNTGRMFLARTGGQIFPRKNKSAGTIDRHYSTDGASIIEPDNDLSLTYPVQSSGVTRQLAVPGTGELAPGAGTTSFLINASPTVITSIATSASRSPLTQLRFRAYQGSITFASGGNIDLSGNASPLVVPDGGVVTLMRTDIASLTWQLMSVSMPVEFGFPYTVDPGEIRSSDSLGVGAANQAIYSRVKHGGTISKVGVRVGASSGSISVALYRNTGSGRSAVPGTRLATSGAVACPASGYAEIDLGSPFTLYPGDWIAISADNTTAQFGSLLSTAADSNLGLGRQFRQAAAHPCPSTPASLVATTGNTHCLIGVA